jgi:nitrite reductase/ring-hydroxylating ferredoxin subunit
MTATGEQADEGWTIASPAANVPDRKPVKVTVDGEDVMLYRIEDQVLAVSNRCTHQGAPLYRGMVKAIGTTPVVTCPAHGSMFQLTDGRVVRGPAMRPIRAYEARINGGAVEVRRPTEPGG